MAKDDQVWYPNTSRYHSKVNTAVSNLNRARDEYEKFVDGAEKNLPLNHPKIAAMYLYRFASYGRDFNQKVKFEDVAKLAQNIQGKSYEQAQAQEIQRRNPRPTVKTQPHQQTGVGQA